MTATRCDGQLSFVRKQGCLGALNSTHRPLLGPVRGEAVGPTENGDVRVFGRQKLVESSRFGRDAKRNVGVALRRRIQAHASVMRFAGLKHAVMSQNRGFHLK